MSLNKSLPKNATSWGLFLCFTLYFRWEYLQVAWDLWINKSKTEYKYLFLFDISEFTEQIRERIVHFLPVI